MKKCFLTFFVLPFCFCLLSASGAPTAVSSLLLQTNSIWPPPNIPPYSGTLTNWIEYNYLGTIYYVCTNNGAGTITSVTGPGSGGGGSFDPSGAAQAVTNGLYTRVFSYPQIALAVTNDATTVQLGEVHFGPTIANATNMNMFDALGNDVAQANQLAWRVYGAFGVQSGSYGPIPNANAIYTGDGLNVTDLGPSTVTFAGGGSPLFSPAAASVVTGMVQSVAQGVVNNSAGTVTPDTVLNKMNIAGGSIGGTTIQGVRLQGSGLPLVNCYYVTNAAIGGLTNVANAAGIIYQGLDGNSHVYLNGTNTGFLLVGQAYGGNFNAPAQWSDNPSVTSLSPPVSSWFVSIDGTGLVLTNPFCTNGTFQGTFSGPINGNASSATTATAPIYQNSPIVTILSSNSCAVTNSVFTFPSTTAMWLWLANNPVWSMFTNSPYNYPYGGDIILDGGDQILTNQILFLCPTNFQWAFSLYSPSAMHNSIIFPQSNNWSEGMLFFGEYMTNYPSGFALGTFSIRNVGLFAANQSNDILYVSGQNNGYMEHCWGGLTNNFGASSGRTLELGDVPGYNQIHAKAWSLTVARFQSRSDNNGITAEHDLFNGAEYGLVEDCDHAFNLDIQGGGMRSGAGSLAGAMILDRVNMCSWIIGCHYVNDDQGVFRANSLYPAFQNYTGWFCQNYRDDGVGYDITASDTTTSNCQYYVISGNADAANAFSCQNLSNNIVQPFLFSQNQIAVGQPGTSVTAGSNIVSDASGNMFSYGGYVAFTNGWNLTQQTNGMLVGCPKYTQSNGCPVTIVIDHLGFAHTYYTTPYTTPQ